MADDIINKASIGRKNLMNEIATRSIDPNFYSALEVLPNPDSVLRKQGKSYKIFTDIFYDAHILGELRSVRSALLGFEYKLMPGGDSPQDIQALELCEKVMQRKPAPLLEWSDTIWNMGCAAFYGFTVHEIVWERFDRYLVPGKLLDKPQHAFVFDIENNLRLLTRDNPLKGEQLGNYKWLLTNHMASWQNPYGKAILSACFWPYVFKHGGFKFFTKFCEKYGIPWTIGKYPRGTPEDVIETLANKLAEMVEDGVAVIPDDGSVELLEHSTRGQPIQERLINLCNREMSKALTSQTLTTEIQGEGSRAASETHRDKEVSVNQSDREMIERTFNQMFAWITEINIQNANPPRLVFFEEAQARKDMAEFLTLANKIVDINQDEAYDRLQLTKPEAGDDIVSCGSIKTDKPPSPEFTERHCPHCQGSEFAQDDILPLTVQAADLADNIISTLPDIVYNKLVEFEKAGKTLAEFEQALPDLLPELDEDRLAEIINLALQTGYLQGMSDV